MNMDTLLQADTDLLLALNGSSSQFVDGLMMALTSGFTWIPMYVALLYLVVKNSETMGQIVLVVACAALCVLLADGIADGIVTELIELVEQEVKKQLGDDVELYSLQDPSILADVRAAGYVTTAPAARLIGMYMKAAEEGVDAMLNLCSSVGEVADSAQDVAKYIGVPIVRVDEEMCREAVRKGQRIGVMATLPTTLEPTKGTILRMARECNRHVELVDCLVDGAFGLDQDQFKARMTEMAGTIADKVDVIVFAQGSMAYCEQYIADKFGKVVLSSPRFGAAELKKALEKKGTI